jgi:purine-binding chemotaxis protein CheW
MSNQVLEPPGRPAAAAAAARGGKYLTFALGREEYGLEILKVREIIGYMDITAVPARRPTSRGSSTSAGR